MGVEFAAELYRHVVYILATIPCSIYHLVPLSVVLQEYHSTMSTTNGNIWAGAGAPEAMQVIERFYILLDAETPEAAKEMSQMCTDDAMFITPGQTFTGRQGN